MKEGRITSVRTFVPTYHGDGRADWTFAVAITFKDAAAMNGPSNEAAIIKKLFPDQAKFRKEEQRRFELLDAHWDVPLNELDLDTRQMETRQEEGARRGWPRVRGGRARQFTMTTSQIFRADDVTRLASDARPRRRDRRSDAHACRPRRRWPP